MDSDAVRDRLIKLAPKLTNLRSLFFGDILQEENEISWIEHGDLAPLVTAFPDLTEFTVRGGSGGLGLRIDEHRWLRRLTVQSGGLDPQVVRDVCASSLEHLELWLGIEEYANGLTTPDDLAPVLSGKAFPKLRHLGLRNSERTDFWISELAEAPVTATLESLDLSLGTLTDAGAQTLLDSPVFRRLKRLDLHHHYLSEETEGRVRAAFTEVGVEIDVSGREEPEEGWDDEEEFHYYTAVSE
jgi:hypothetical protein